MMKLLKRFRKNKSTTLIELVMTIVVVGIVALPISVTLAKHVQSVFVSQDYTLALNLARLEMEKIINTAYASIATGTTVYPNYQGYAYDLTSTVSYAFGSALTGESVKLVSISVTKAGQVTVLVTLKNYIAKNITWGL
jgi:Tfp pilus assembly protein PilE